jgi:hypothetical protein
MQEELDAMTGAPFDFDANPDFVAQYDRGLWVRGWEATA